MDRDDVYAATARERRRLADLIGSLDEVQLAAQALDRLAQSSPNFIVPLRRLRGIRLRANDIKRTWRDGEEISGPAAALMLAVCGRTSFIDQLDGPGLPLLRRRISG